MIKDDLYFHIDLHKSIYVIVLRLSFPKPSTLQEKEICCGKKWLHSSEWRDEMMFDQREVLLKTFPTSTSRPPFGSI